MVTPKHSVRGTALHVISTYHLEAPVPHLTSSKAANTRSCSGPLINHIHSSVRCPLSAFSYYQLRGDRDEQSPTGSPGYTRPGGSALLATITHRSGIAASPVTFTSALIGSSEVVFEEVYAKIILPHTASNLPQSALWRSQPNCDIGIPYDLW